MKKLLVRLLYGFLFAIPLMLLTYAMAQATPGASVDQQQAVQPSACAACHADFQKAWEGSAHGRATSAQAFKDSWTKQGEPERCLSCHTTGYDSDKGTYMAEGVTCQACHDVSQSKHPLEPIKADRSSKLCGTCHTETYFEWQVSAHRQQGLDCISCHNPHETSMKADSSAAQCATCHKERSANFTHSGHAEKGLVCADCHLPTLQDTELGEGHARRDHSFFVRLSTCNQCHAYQMHDAANVHDDAAPTPEAPDALAAVEKVSVVPEPSTASPIGFASLAGLIGLAAGVILGPTMERWARRKNNDDEEA